MQTDFEPQSFHNPDHIAALRLRSTRRFAEMYLEKGRDLQLGYAPPIKLIVLSDHNK